MAGIYVHIPFCKSRCAYCDFFSTTRTDLLEEYVTALCREITERRCEQLSEGIACEANVDTVYFGGGTPSTLTPSQLTSILDCIYENYRVAPDAEVTLEMNPDDLDTPPENPPWRGGSWGWTFNRISLGIQTFDDSLLRLIHRRHDSSTAIRAVQQLQAAGCDNISIDLIYGLPGQTLEQWQGDLDTAFSLGIQHLSAYALSYEPGTVLSRWRDEGLVQEADEELSVTMYAELCRRTRQAGFEHYEISNFALPGRRSRHNSSYWTGIPYLGFGPGAHSYDGLRTRRANKPDLQSYLSFSQQTEFPLPVETDLLSDAELFDEAVMCGLRTCEGIDLGMIEHRFGRHRLNALLQAARPHINAARLIIHIPSSSQQPPSATYLRLAESAIMTSDDIMSDLMA